MRCKFLWRVHPLLLFACLVSVLQIGKSAKALAPNIENVAVVKALRENAS